MYKNEHIRLLTTDLKKKKKTQNIYRHTMSDGSQFTCGQFCTGVGKSK